MEAHAGEVNTFVNDLIDDLNSRTVNVPESEKPSVYVGGLSSRGFHGMSSTCAYYAPFTLNDAKNVITPEMVNYATSVVNIDIEVLPSLNPEIIFVDYNGLSLS